MVKEISWVFSEKISNNKMQFMGVREECNGLA
jgi:hypothetical protein